MFLVFYFAASKLFLAGLVSGVLFALSYLVSFLLFVFLGGDFLGAFSFFLYRLGYALAFCGVFRVYVASLAAVRCVWGPSDVIFVWRYGYGAWFTSRFVRYVVFCSSSFLMVHSRFVVGFYGLLAIFFCLVCSFISLIGPFGGKFLR